MAFGSFSMTPGYASGGWGGMPEANPLSNIGLGGIQGLYGGNDPLMPNAVTGYMTPGSPQGVTGAYGMGFMDIPTQSTSPQNIFQGVISALYNQQDYAAKHPGAPSLISPQFARAYKQVPSLIYSLLANPTALSGYGARPLSYNDFSRGLFSSLGF